VEDDHQIMARVRAGEVEAFEMLYARYSAPLLNFFYQMCFDRIAAEDHLQETFLRVWRARESWRPIGKVSTWLFQIAKNHWFNEYDKAKRRPFHKVAGGEAGADRCAALADEAAGSSPAAVAGARELQQAIERAVSALSDKLRVVFVLARYRGLPYGEIAEICGIPVGTVKSRMALAERNLRGALQEHLA